MLGPLTNPAGANCQLLGVFAPQLTEMFAEALRLLGAKSAFVVHGHDGLDEISVCAPTRVSQLENDVVRTYDIYPEKFFGRLAEPDQMTGGDPGENAAITRNILTGEKGPRRDVVLLNTAAALVACQKAPDLQAGIGLAQQAIDSGAAMAKLDALVAYTRENG
jgi:anthranilate phosphoribosyltransferase